MKLSPITPDPRHMAKSIVRRFTVAELINEGRQCPLPEDRCDVFFEVMDGFTRLGDRRCPRIGAPDLRHPLERMFARAASKGVTVVTSDVSSTGAIA